jgi:hypothetical protein
MNAVEALSVAQAAGLRIVLDGDGLLVDASAQPPDALIDALSHNKAEIVALLRLGNDGSTSKGRQALDDERSDIRSIPVSAETDTKAIPWAEWKALELNRLFQEQGITGEPGRITAATVLHGERKAGQV